MVTIGRPQNDGPGAGIRSGGVAKVPSGGSWLQAHLALVAVLGLLLVGAAGGGGYLLLSSSGDPVEAGAPSPTTGVRRTGGTGTGSPSPTPSTSPGMTGITTSGRNPFLWIGRVVPGTDDTSDPTATTTNTSTDGPPVTGPTTVPTVTATRSVTATRTATRTATSTITTTNTVRYLSLHGWTADDRPQFWINDQAYTPALDELFGGDVTYTARNVVDGVAYAAVSYSGNTIALSDGQVVLLS